MWPPNKKAVEDKIISNEELGDASVDTRARTEQCLIQGLKEVLQPALDEITARLMETNSNKKRTRVQAIMGEVLTSNDELWETTY